MIGAPETSEQVIAPEAPVVQHDKAQRAKHEQARQQAAKPRALKAKRGRAQMAEHQGPVREGVDGYRESADDEAPARTLQRRNEKTQYDVEECRQQRPFHCPRVGRRIGRECRFLSEQDQNVFRIPEQQPEGQADRCRRPERLAHGAAHVAHRMGAAAALGRDHRCGCRYDADAENHHREKEVGAEGAGGQRVRSEPPHHDDVRCVDRNLREICRDERPCERKRRSYLRVPEMPVRSECGEGGVHGASLKKRSA